MEELGEERWGGGRRQEEEERWGRREVESASYNQDLLCELLKAIVKADFGGLKSQVTKSSTMITLSHLLTALPLLQLHTYTEEH